MRIGPPPECEDIVDQISAALRRPTDLIDMLCWPAPAGNLRLNHLRIAKNGANDVVEVMRNPTCKRSDHLHATRPFQPHREFRSLTFQKFTLERIGYGVPGQPRYRHALDLVPYRPEAVERHDASNPTRPGQRHAGPGTHTGDRESVSGWAWRQSHCVRNGDACFSNTKLLGHCQRLIWPTRRECISVSGP